MRRRQVNILKKLGLPPAEMAVWDENHTPKEPKGKKCPKCPRYLVKGYEWHVKFCKGDKTAK